MATTFVKLAIQVGDKVKANCEEGWLPGVVVKAKKDGSKFQVELDNDEGTLWFDADDLKHLGPVITVTPVELDPKPAKKKRSKKKVQESSVAVVKYAFQKEGKGVWCFEALTEGGEAIREVGGRLPAGSNVVYLLKEDYPECPESVTATYEISY